MYDESLKGFSLVELSIVLVILGLLTGGVLTGQNLIRAAELRSIPTEFQAYQTAVHTFRDKYFALPGDMTNATDFWDSAGGSGFIGDGCETATGTGTQTCNGDGDGTLDKGDTASEYIEVYTFWQHLANAGLVEGSYSGKAESLSKRNSVIGINVPASKISGAAFEAEWVGTTSSASNTWMFPGSHGNIMFFGTKSDTSSYFRPVLTPEEMWSVDTKMDDGLPGQGRIITYDQDAPFATTCITTNVASTAKYNLTSTDLSCTITFDQVF